MLQLFSLACVISYCAVATIVGARLGRLAVRTGEAPERYIGAALLFGGAIGYPMTILAAAAERQPETDLRLVVLGTIGLHLSAWCNVRVWRSVFHPDSALARNTGLVMTGALLLSCVDTIVNHAAWISSAMRPSSIAMQVFDLLVQAMAWVLAASSTFRYAAMMSRRIRLGLGDAVVANRLWLWGWVSAVVVVQFTIGVATLLTRGTTSAGYPPSSIAISVLGLVLALLLGLAFLPPGRYARWLEQHAERDRQLAQL